MTYIIHGATGAQGAPVLTQLLAAGKHAVAAVRDPDAHAGTAAIRVDNTSVKSLTEAYRGAAGVFIHLPVAPEEARLAQANAIVAAVAAARPARVVISTSGSIVDAPGNALQAPASAAITVLIEGVQATGVSTAVVAPRLFLENLLLPMVIGGARAEGVLGYPIREDFAVSWSSHLDVAEVVVRLFEMPDLRGVVGVGHLPACSGAISRPAWRSSCSAAWLSALYYRLTSANFSSRCWGRLPRGSPVSIRRSGRLRQTPSIRPAVPSTCLG